MAYVLALPENICERLMKCIIHILKALDISYLKIQEKVEIITNHKLQFWKKYLKTDTVGDATLRLTKFDIEQFITVSRVITLQKFAIFPHIC